MPCRSGSCLLCLLCWKRRGAGGGDGGELGKAGLAVQGSRGKLFYVQTCVVEGAVGSDHCKLFMGLHSEPACAAVARLQHILAGRLCGTRVRVQAGV